MQELAALVGVPVREVLFSEESAGLVTGVRLDDGTRVVVKTHRPHVAREHLVACHRIQSVLADRGFPCPRPLKEPQPFGLGLATVEELVDEGERCDLHDPLARRAAAEVLAALVTVAVDLVEIPGLQRGALVAPKGLWPVSHSPRFDFGATRRGTEWIDAIAARARARLHEHVGRTVVAHNDWSAKHFRFVDGRIRVVYDWDSLERADEPRLVGQAAATFTATWYLDVSLVPEPAEARAFVAEYEEAQRRRFQRMERERLAAAATYVMAYNARCEACTEPLATEFPPGSLRDGLARYAEEYLTL